MRARLLLLCYMYALNAENPAILQSPESVKVEDGGTIKLQCRLQVADTYCYTVIWTKIDPRTKELVYPKDTDTNSSSRRENVCHFSVKNAKVSDSGTYYCSVVLGSMTYFGSGSSVTVTQENRPESPSVDILWPSAIRPLIPLLCVVSGVVPSEVRVFWVIDGEEHSGFTESIWTKNNDEIVESCQNQVLVRAEEWERGALCTCVVDFAGNNASKSVQNQGTSGRCTLLLYAAIAGAGLIILVTISIAVFLHRGHSVRSDGGAGEQRRTTSLEHTHPSGKQANESAIDRTVTEVLYASLEESSLTRRT